MRTIPQWDVYDMWRPPRRRRPGALRDHWSEAGRITAMVPVASLAAIICVGIGVDFSGQTQLEQDLRDQATYCARVSTTTVPIGARADSQAISAAAYQCLSEQGVDGIVSLVDDRVAVEIQASYTTHLLSIVAIDHLPVRAVGSASLSAGR